MDKYIRSRLRSNNQPKIMPDRLPSKRHCQSDRTKRTVPQPQSANKICMDLKHDVRVKKTKFLMPTTSRAVSSNDSNNARHVSKGDAVSSLFEWNKQAYQRLHQRTLSQNKKRSAIIEDHSVEKYESSNSMDSFNMETTINDVLNAEFPNDLLECSNIPDPLDISGIKNEAIPESDTISEVRENTSSKPLKEHDKTSVNPHNSGPIHQVKISVVPLKRQTSTDNSKLKTSTVLVDRSDASGEKDKELIETVSPRSNFIRHHSNNVQRKHVKKNKDNMIADKNIAGLESYKEFIKKYENQLTRHSKDDANFNESQNKSQPFTESNINLQTTNFRIIKHLEKNIQTLRRRLLQYKTKCMNLSTELNTRKSMMHAMTPTAKAFFELQCTGGTINKTRNKYPEESMFLALAIRKVSCECFALLSKYFILPPTYHLEHFVANCIERNINVTEKVNELIKDIDQAAADTSTNSDILAVESNNIDDIDTTLNANETDIVNENDSDVEIINESQIDVSQLQNTATSPQTNSNLPQSTLINKKHTFKILRSVELNGKVVQLNKEETIELNEGEIFQMNNGRTFQLKNGQIIEIADQQKQTNLETNVHNPEELRQERCESTSLNYTQLPETTNKKYIINEPQSSQSYSETVNEIQTNEAMLPQIPESANEFSQSYNNIFNKIQTNEATFIPQIPESNSIPLKRLIVIRKSDLKAMNKIPMCHFKKRINIKLVNKQFALIRQNNNDNLDMT